MPNLIETSWDDIPATASSECRRGHQRNTKNTRIHTRTDGATELRCRVCDRLGAAARRAAARKTTNKGER